MSASPDAATNTGASASTGAAAGVGLAAGLALATLVLPQVASALNPTAWGTVAVTLFVGLLGGAVQSFRVKRQTSAVGWLLLLVFVSIATVIVYTTHSHVLRKPRSVPDQIQAQLRQMLDHGNNHVVVNERLQLHPSDQRSWVVVIQHASNSKTFADETDTRTRTKNSPQPISDELRIYDVDDGWLTLELDYRPVGHGLTARDWVAPAGAPAAFDYNHNGFPEIIAAYALSHPVRELPFIVDWSGDRYTLRPIERARPTFSRAGVGRAIIRDRRRWYQTKVKLPDGIPGAASTPPLVGYQMSALAFVRSPSVRVLTGYFAARPNIREQERLQLRANQIVSSTLQLSVCRYRYPFCPGPSTPQTVDVPPDETLGSALLNQWPHIASKWRWIPADSP